MGKLVAETDKQVYDACIGVASTLLAPAQLRMAKLALSMHTMSPTVRMFDQIATQNNAKDVQCDVFVAIASKKICDNDALKDLLKTWDKLEIVSLLFKQLSSFSLTLPSHLLTLPLTFIPPLTRLPQRNNCKDYLKIRASKTWYKFAFQQTITKPLIPSYPYSPLYLFNNAKDKQCEVFVTIASMRACDIDALKNLLITWNKLEIVSWLYNEQLTLLFIYFIYYLLLI